MKPGSPSLRNRRTGTEESKDRYQHGAESKQEGEAWRWRILSSSTSFLSLVTPDAHLMRTSPSTEGRRHIQGGLKTDRRFCASTRLSGRTFFNDSDVVHTIKASGGWTPQKTPRQPTCLLRSQDFGTLSPTEFLFLFSSPSDFVTGESPLAGKKTITI